jgi:hypothetical protein
MATGCNTMGLIRTCLGKQRGRLGPTRERPRQPALLRKMCLVSEGWVFMIASRCRGLGSRMRMADMDEDAAFGQRCAAGHDPTVTFPLGVLEMPRGIFKALVGFINYFDFAAYLGNRPVDCTRQAFYPLNSNTPSLIPIMSTLHNPRCPVMAFAYPLRFRTSRTLAFRTCLPIVSAFTNSWPKLFYLSPLSFNCTM